MIPTQAAIANAAAEVRAAEATLRSIIAELHRDGVWTGSDAERFQQEWQDLVSSRLQTAAGRLDGCDFIPFP
jgi:uncharacterized protein YukE